MQLCFLEDGAIACRSNEGRKLTGTACAEAMSGAEEPGRRERVEDNAGGGRVERRVRQRRRMRDDVWRLLSVSRL